MEIDEDSDDRPRDDDDDDSDRKRPKMPVPKPDTQLGWIVFPSDGGPCHIPAHKIAAVTDCFPDGCQVYVSGLPTPFLARGRTAAGILGDIGRAINLVKPY